MNQRDKTTLWTSADSAMDYLDRITARSATPSPEAIKNLDVFEEPMPETGKDTTDTIDLLHAYGSPATMASNGGRYFEFLVGGSHPAALAANWLASAWDQNAVLGATSPINACIETITESGSGVSSQ